MCQKYESWLALGSGQKYCNNMQAYFFGPPCSYLIINTHNTQYSKLWYQLFSTVSDNFATWSLISLESNSTSENWIANNGYSHTWVLNLVNFGLQSAKNEISFNPPKINCFGCSYLGHKRRCALKISQMAKDNQGLLTHIYEDGFPPNNFWTQIQCTLAYIVEFTSEINLMFYSTVADVKILKRHWSLQRCFLTNNILLLCEDIWDKVAKLKCRVLAR